MSSEKYPCMIICGGTSKRFGSDKMLALLAGKPLLSHVIDIVRPQVGSLAINAADETTYQEFKLPVIKDVLPGGLGPLAGVLTAMQWAEALGFSRVLTCAGDTPFLPADFAERLVYVPGDRIAVCHSGERVHNVCAVWPTGLAGVLRRDMENGARGVGVWIATQKFAHVPFEINTGIDAFFNINTPDDLAKALNFPPHTLSFRP